MAPFATIDPAKFLYAYPIFYLLAIQIGAGIVIFEIYRRRLPFIPLLVTMVWGLIFAVIGSKLFTLAPQEFIEKLKTGCIFSVHEKVYLGWLIGGMIGIKIFRKILGFKFDLFDLFTFALPVGFMLMRIGCLLGGCCFGKHCNLPWSIYYVKGSECYNYHLYQGLIQSDAHLSLPVHPAQVYEIVAMIFIILLLFYLRRYFKKPGSLGYTYLVLHSIFRFFIDFSKEGGTYIYGLKSMQWFLLFAIPAGILFIRWREKSRNVESKMVITERPFILNFVLFFPSILFLFFPRGWLTPAEFKVLLIAILITLIIFVYKGLQYLCNRYKIFIRIPATIASIAILETSLDTTVAKDTLKDIFYIEIDGGYMKGAYKEICGGLVPYDAGGMGGTIYFKDKYNTILGLNVRGYTTRVEDLNAKYGYAGNLIFSHEYFGFDLGMGKVFYDREEMPSEGYPSLGLRLGLRNKAFIEGEFMRHSPADFPSPLIKLGCGIGTGGKNESVFRFGIGFLGGFYANPVLYLFDNRLKISPFLMGGGEEGEYQLNLTLGYRYYFR